MSLHDCSLDSSSYHAAEEHLDHKIEHMGQDHHLHGISKDADSHWLIAAILSLGIFCLFEAVIGFSIDSVAVMSDAGHMFTDILSLILSLVTVVIAARPSTDNYTFGYLRWEILSAQLNGWGLIIMAVIFGQQGITRIWHLTSPPANYIIITSLLGIAINLVVSYFLAKANRESLNIEGAYQHILSDLMGFVCTLIAGIVIYLWHWNVIDVLACLVISLLMALSGIKLVRRSNRILLEAAPSEIPVTTVREKLLEQNGVEDIHDLHIWQIDSHTIALSTHVIISPDSVHNLIRSQLEALLSKEYGIGHTVIQID